MGLLHPSSTARRGLDPPQKITCSAVYTNGHEHKLKKLSCLSSKTSGIYALKIHSE